MADHNESQDDINNVKKKGQNEISALAFEAPDSTHQSRPQSNNINVGRRELLTRDDAPWWHSQFNLMLCVFGLLVIAAGLFILLTPAPTLATQNNTLIEADGQSSQGLNGASAVSPDKTLAPWDESRNTQARADSQDILSQLLISKKELEAKNVSEWGAEGYDAALEKAAEGDELYKIKDFQNAINLYQAALDEMLALDELIPEVLKALVSQGNAAIDQGKTDLARQRFQSAIELDRNNIPALRGIGRAATLDQVLGIMRQAAIDEQQFQRSDDIEFLNLAGQKYQQILLLDPRTEQAEIGAQRVADLTTDKQFRDAMSSGFSALFKQRFAIAKQHFSAALKIRPNDETASAAYRQSLASDKRSSLTSMLTSAKGMERREEWASALSTYQAVLQRDPNQVSAKLGEIRSQARKQLDQSIQLVLADKLALSRSAPREKADAVLADAQRIKNKGAVLTGQIADMQASLKQLDSTIKVSFSSDSLTEVGLTKAGSKKINLGKFALKKLMLKPGRYTISGVRLGFKDVRRDIELRVTGDDIQSYSIKCITPVNGSSVVTN
jgi:tetratricopeptide (TPR) repeat protein